MSSAEDKIKQAQAARQLRENTPEAEFAEQPNLPAGTRLRCRKCDSNAIIYPVKTVDPRWVIGYCTACKKRQIADVIAMGF